MTYPKITGHDSKVPIAQINSIELCYEIIHPKPPPGENSPLLVESGTKLLLIQGLGGQLISWDSQFVDELVSRGFEVIVFDNRDSGLSTKFADSTVQPAYSIEDMADDALELCAYLSLDPFHVLGISMGGMIAQALAIKAPSSLLSLCSIMSTTGNRQVGMPTPEGIKAIMTKPGEDLESIIETGLKTWRVIWGSGFPIEEDRIKAKLEAEYERSYYPEGVMRQVMAIISAKDRTEQLGKLRIPVLVIHGQDDPLIAVSGGQACANAIAQSKFVSYAGMGHSMPSSLIATMVDEIVANVSRS